MHIDYAEKQPLAIPLKKKKKELVFLTKIVILLFLFTAGNPAGYAQVVNIPSTDLIEKEYPDEDVILFDSNIDYTFEIADDGAPTAVIETRRDIYVALKENVKAVATCFYDDYSEIEKHKVTGTGYFSKRGSQRCGDYEIDGIFYHDARVCEFLLQFSEAGQYLTVETRKVYHDVKYFASVPLYSPYLLHLRKVRFHIPNGLDLDFRERNFDGFNITSERPISDDSGVGILRYEAGKIPASRDLDHLPSNQCCYPYLVVLTKGYTRSGEYVPLIDNLDRLYAWYHSLVSDDPASAELQTLTDDLVEGKTSDSDRIAAVYYWVQDKIRYIAFENGPAAFVPEKPDVVRQNRYGDCKGMANLTRAMLRHLGYDARLCWIYTGGGCNYETLPTIATHNHCICAVMLDDSLRFLDPTVDYTVLSGINEGIQGKEAMVEDGENYLLATVPATPDSVNLKRVTNRIALDGGKLRVEGKITLRGIEKKQFQYFSNHLNAELKDKLVDFFITHIDNNFRLTDVFTPSADTMTPQFDITYDMEVSNNVLDLGDEMLLSLDFYRELQEAKIDTLRPFRYDLNYRRVLQQEVSFVIPEGMAVKKLPDSLYIENPKYTFSAGYSAGDSVLVYRKSLALHESLLDPADIEDWNDAVDALKTFYNEMIVLKKQ